MTVSSSSELDTSKDSLKGISSHGEKENRTLASLTIIDIWSLCYWELTVFTSTYSSWQSYPESLLLCLPILTSCCGEYLTLGTWYLHTHLTFLDCDHSALTGMGWELLLCALPPAFILVLSLAITKAMLLLLEPDSVFLVVALTGYYLGWAAAILQLIPRS